MTTEILISVLLSIIAFFLVGIHREIKQIGEKVEKLMINEAASRERLDAQEERITKLELKKHPHA